MSWGEEGLLWQAVTDCCESIAHLETQWDRNRLEKAVRNYFTKAAKSLEFGRKPVEELMQDYCTNAYGSIFCGLGDRDWLEQADFLMAVDAGIKDFFPPQAFAGMPKGVFEQMVLKSADRGYDFERFYAYRWETIQRIVTGKISSKKVREAIDTGREQAYDNMGESANPAEDFVGMWVSSAVQALMVSTNGIVESVLPEEMAVELFQATVQEGGLPAWIINQVGLPPPGWPFIDQVVHDAYASIEAQGSFGDWPPKGKGKGKGKDKGKSDYVNHIPVKGKGGWKTKGGKDQADSFEGEPPFKSARKDDFLW